MSSFVVARPTSGLLVPQQIGNVNSEFWLSPLRAPEFVG
jgi:hypothetical protein